MPPELKTQLLTILDYILQTEATSYEECDEPENHIYHLALEAKLALTFAQTH